VFVCVSVRGCECVVSSCTSSSFSSSFFSSCLYRSVFPEWNSLVYLSLEEVVVHAGQKVLMEVD
jgi:hypothetical protein